MTENLSQHLSGMAVYQQHPKLKDIGVSLRNVEEVEYKLGDPSFMVYFYFHKQPMKILFFHLLGQEELLEFLAYDREELIAHFFRHLGKKQVKLVMKVTQKSKATSKN